MKLIDLHVHTTASDGIMGPSKIIDYAMSRGIAVMAITDHDTVDGLDEGFSHVSNRDFTLIPGIEFSVEYDAGTFHLLGLFIDRKNRELHEAVAYLKEMRSTRVDRIVQDLKSRGIDIPLDEVRRAARGASMGRPHVARILVKHGFASSVKDAFLNFMVKGKPGYVKKEKITLDNAIRIVRNAGGIAVLAHPVSLGLSMPAYEGFLGELKDKGIQGLEAYAAMHSADQAAAFVNIAEKHGLLITGGSDFHGDKDETIGYWAENEPIPAEIADALLRYRARGD